MIDESCTLFVFRHCYKIRFQIYCKPENIGFLNVLRLKDCSFKVQYAKMCNMFCFLPFVFLPNKLKSQCRLFPICPFLTSSSSACLSHKITSMLKCDKLQLWFDSGICVFVRSVTVLRVCEALRMLRVETK